MQQQSIKTSIGILVLFSLVVIGGLFLGKKQHEQKRLSSPVSFENMNIEKVATNKIEQGVEIKIVYPKTTITPIDTTIINSVNESLQSFIQESGADPKERPYSFEGNFETVFGLRTVTFIYTFYTYTGGAHGNSVIKTFTFDTTGKLLTFEDVFNNPQDALIALVPSVYTRIKSTLGEMFQETWVQEGILPTQQNYQAFYLTKDSIGFVFSPYQVAPYAAGIVRVEIPFTEQSFVFKNTYTQ